MDKNTLKGSCWHSLNSFEKEITAEKVRRPAQMWKLLEDSDKYKKNLHDKDKGEVEEGWEADKLEAVFVETPFQNKDLKENIFSTLVEASLTVFHGQIMYNNTGQKCQ